MQKEGYNSKINTELKVIEIKIKDKKKEVQQIYIVTVCCNCDKII
jgi:hypothetical protein